MKFHHVIITIITLLFSLPPVFSADELTYINNGNTRFSFAQLHVGFDILSIPKSGRIPTDDGNHFHHNETMAPRVTIGGTHFWGHADFYVSFPITNQGQTYGQNEVFYSPGIETGAKFYPYRLEYYKIRPFIGASWIVSNYQHNVNNNKGPIISFHQFPILYGLTYATRYGLFEIGGALLTKKQFDYPLSKTTTSQTELPNRYFWFGYKYLIDTTDKVSMDHLDVPEQKNDWMLSIGPSTAFQMSTSSFNDANRSYLKETTGTAIFPELGLGYYLNDWDAAVNISYRNITISNQAFGVTQERSRKVISIEAYKYLFDYHGFAPYVGLSKNIETLAVTDSESSINLSQSFFRLGYSYIIGWDIRPTRNPFWLLKTNLRYTPNNKLHYNGGQSFSFDQFEFNFIQFTLFPGRLLHRLN